MKLVIEIPKEFEQHFQTDRFNDSLNRLCADANFLAGLYEKELALMLCVAFRNAIEIKLDDYQKMLDKMNDERFISKEYPMVGGRRRQGRTYAIIRTLEARIAIAENNEQNTLLVTVDVLKEILGMLRWCNNGTA